MNPLSEVFTQDLDNTIAQAKLIGRYNIADYLTLKASNDAIRRESIKWLIDSVLEVVFTFNRHGAKIKIEQKEKHRFKFGNSELSGAILNLRQGVRCLSFETGWTQSPGDGVIKGGALACAKITHFGFKKQNEDLVLLRYEEKPQWFALDGENHRISFNMKSLRKHFETFLN